MIWIAAAAILADVVTVAAFARLLQSTYRQQARERGLLLNQLLNLAGKPWQPAPATNGDPPASKERDTVVSPEQLPDDHDWS